MKIVSSFIEDLHLNTGKYHAFEFESSYLLKLFKYYLNAYFNRQKQSDTLFLNFLDNNNNELKAKQFYFINFNCHQINLETDKDIKIQIQKILFHQLENNPILLESFFSFQKDLMTFTNELELEDEQLTIHFHANDKTIMKLIQSLEIDIEYEENDYVPNYKLREFIISFLLTMNNYDKIPVILISYPESDIGRLEFQEVINFLMKLNITVLVLSSQQDFLVSAANNRLFLVNKMGQLYDIITLKKELTEFNIISNKSSEKLVRSISLRDFREDYQLMNQDVKDFLISNKW